MNEFDISLNTKLGQFNNSIDGFNKVFNNSINSANENLNAQASFEDVLNSLNKTNSIQSGVEYFNDENMQTRPIENVSPTAKMASDIGQGFMNGLTNLSQINKESEQAFETFASGGDISVHDVMIASQKSSLAMQMAIQLRNQMLNAYNEFKNMSI